MALFFAPFRKKKKVQKDKREYYLDEDWEYYPETVSEICLQTNKKSKYIACDGDGQITPVDDRYHQNAAFYSIPDGTDGESIALVSRTTGLFLSIDNNGEVIGVKTECKFKIKSHGSGKYSFQSQENKKWLDIKTSKNDMTFKGTKNGHKFFVGNVLVDQTVDKWKFPSKNDIILFNSPQCVSCARIPDKNYVVVQQKDDEKDDSGNDNDEDNEPEEKEEPDQFDVKFIKKTGEWINIFGEQVVTKGHIKRWHLKIIPKFVPSSPYKPGRVMSALEKVPVVGYGAAGFHMVRGRGDYAKKAAAKCTNATIVTTVVIGAVAFTVSTGGAGGGMIAGGLAAAQAGAAAGAVAGGAGVFAESQISKTIKDDDIKQQCLQGTAKDYAKGIAGGATKGAISGMTAGMAEGAGEMFESLQAMDGDVGDAAKMVKKVKDAKEQLDLGGQLGNKIVGENPTELGDKVAKKMIEEMGGGVQGIAQDEAIERGKAYLQKKKAANPYPEDELKRDVENDKFGKNRPKDHIANVIVGVADAAKLGQNGGYFLKPCKGYGYNTKTGRKMRKKSKKKYGPKSYIYDIITVELNMESLELGFFINNEYQGAAYKVNKKKSYCLAVSLNSPYYEVQLV